MFTLWRHQQASVALAQMECLNRHKWQAKATVALAKELLISAVGMPARKVVRSLAHERRTVGGVQTFVEISAPTGSGIRLLEEALLLLRETAPFWFNAFSTETKYVILSNTVEYYTYCLFDRTVYLNPWNALKLGDVEATALNATFVVMAISHGHLLNRRRGSMGICFMSRLSLQAGIRFLEKMQRVNANATIPLIIKELRAAIPFRQDLK